MSHFDPLSGESETGYLSMCTANPATGQPVPRVSMQNRQTQSRDPVHMVRYKVLIDVYRCLVVVMYMYVYAHLHGVQINLYTYFKEVYDFWCTEVDSSVFQLVIA